jgi:hypothetical protein
MCSALKARGGTSGLVSLQCKVQVEKDVDAVGTPPPDTHTHTLSRSLALAQLHMDGYNYVSICNMMSVCEYLFCVYVFLLCTGVALCGYVKAAAKEAISQRGHFALAIPGTLTEA